ncbi:MAG: hypothetical protein AAFY15_14605, partial [Cyanobacteria bacterium J06648_11]
SCLSFSFEPAESSVATVLVGTCKFHDSHPRQTANCSAARTWYSHTQRYERQAAQAVFNLSSIASATLDKCTATCDLVARCEAVSFDVASNNCTLSRINWNGTEATETLLYVNVNQGPRPLSLGAFSPAPRKRSLASPAKTSVAMARARECLLEIERLERRTIPLLEKIEIAGDGVAQVAESVDSLSGVIDEMYPRIDLSLLVTPPLEVALFAAENAPYVGPVLKGTQLRRFLAQARKNLKDARKKLERAGAALERLLVPLVRATDAIYRGADLFRPFAPAIFMRNIVTFVIKLIECAGELNSKEVDEGLALPSVPTRSLGLNNNNAFDAAASLEDDLSALPQVHHDGVLPTPESSLLAGLVLPWC